MSSHKRRGLPNDRATAKKSKPSRKKRRSVFRILLRLFVGWVVVVMLGAATFIGTRCYSNSSPASGAPAADVGSGPGYVRAEAFTYLTLPEWFIVYSADEYAAHAAQRPPSAFPYVGSAFQYWKYYSAVCRVTKRTYRFETGYHAMLAIIGTSFTVESTMKAVYENTVGRITELLSSIDTPEDAYARQTAKEYGTFMHTVPWYEFPFASKLAGLWRNTPLRGPHTLRKLERRIVLTAEYGGKAVYGWIIGKASGAAYAAEELRIHARIDNATEAVFSDARVKQVKPLGPGSYIVTLPRYEEFTKTALALNARGVKFLDIAGNDDMLITVLARRGVSPTIPYATLVASHPILTDPTMQRMAFSISVSHLREVSQQLDRAHAVIEHLYDY